MNKNVAVVGCGYWGKNLVRNFARIGALHTVCDADSTRLQAIASDHPGTEMQSDYERLLENDDIAGIVLATPAASHYSMAKEALIAGKDVFVEKPFTTNTAEAMELLELSRRERRLITVGHLLLYHPAVRMLKEYIKSGELGDVFYIYSTRVNLGQVRRDENALWRLVPHDIAMFAYLLDAFPEVVSAYGGSYLRPGAVDVVFVTLKFGNAIGHVQASWLDPHKTRQATLVGSEKMAVFDDMEPEYKLKIFDKGIVNDTLAARTGEVIFPGVPIMEPLYAECKEFAECMDTREAPTSGPELGVKVVEALEAAQNLIDGGRD